MDFKFYFAEQLKKHPSMRPQDVAKMCYQAAMGAEHLLSDISAAKRYFYAELDYVEPRDGELVENLSDKICRVDLGVWKRRGLDPERLFDAFCATATVPSAGKAILSESLADADAFIKEQNGAGMAFSVEEWVDFLKKYTEMGMPAVHHSEEYRKNEKPSYRIVSKGLLDGLK